MDTNYGGYEIQALGAAGVGDTIGTDAAGNIGSPSGGMETGAGSRGGTRQAEERDQ